MRAVLLHSRKVGSSARVSVAGAGRAVVSGMEKGDVVGLHFFLGEDDAIYFAADKDESLDIPEGATFIVARHEKCSGSRVSVDLV